MFGFIFSQIILYLTIVFLLFLPGYFLLLAVWGKNKIHHPFEKILISLGSSVVIIDFLMLILGKSNIPLNKTSISLTIILFILITSFVYFVRKEKTHFKKNKTEESKINFSKTQTITIILILFLTVFIKTIYLSNTIFPTSTDLGHHMYWSQSIIKNGKIPVYQKTDILKLDDGTYTMSSPKKIADFIVGEHLIFAAISIISGIGVISSFPTLILHFFNIAAIFAIFILTIEIFKNHSNYKNISILCLLFAGPLYALSSPQTKFASGGVIGNTLGNFFIPLIILLYIKALREKNSTLLSFALLMSFGLAYTHHLSMFIFIFIFIFSLLFFFLFNFKEIIERSSDWLRLFFSPSIMVLFIFGIIMVFLVHTPSYLNSSAIDTAVGEPSKSTRTGLTFAQLTTSSGDARMILGLLGFIILLFSKKTKKEYGIVFIFGWTASILIMSLRPGILFIDIPSDRIANYFISPLSILGGFAFAYFFESLKKNSALFLKNSFSIVLFFILFVFLSTSGLIDNSNSISDGGNMSDAVQTFQASKYLSDFTEEKDIILKDHNYLIADSWIKLFFMKGYNYPLSRGYFKRYEDATKEREQCTLAMISAPNSKEATDCFEGTGTDFIMVNPKYDDNQFEKTRNFWKIYASNSVASFYKP